MTGTEIGFRMNLRPGISLNQLRYFTAVARARSFTAASRELGVSQPALGLQVRQLESRLGTDLLVRHARGVDLTCAGEIFFAHASEVLEALKRAEQSLAAVAIPSTRPIPLGVTPTIGRALVGDLLKAFPAEAPHFKLLLREGLSDDLLQLIRGGELEAAFCYDPPPNNELHIEPLFREDLVLVGRPDMVTSNRPVRFTDLPGYPLALGSADRASRRFIEQLAAKHGTKLDVRVEIAPISLKREVLMRNGYCTIVPYGLFLPDIQTGQLGAARIKPPMTRTMALVMNRGLPEGVRNELIRVTRRSIATRIDERELGWSPLRAVESEA